MYVNVEIDEDEVLQSLDSSSLIEELRKRRELPPLAADAECPTLLTIYEEFSRRRDAPQCLRDYLYVQLGRVLPCEVIYGESG